MSRLTDRLEHDLREVGAGAQPAPSAWESILARLGDEADSVDAFVLAPATGRSKRPVWLAVAAAALIVIFGSIAVLTRAGDDRVISPAGPDETVVDFPSLTTTFVSPTYGYSFGHPDRVALAPATELWDPGDEQLDTIQLDDRFDAVETGLLAYFVGASTAIPDGVSIDEWYDENVSPSGCGEPRSQQPEITIDGQPGRIAECPNLIEATVVAGGRLYLFMLGHERRDSRAFFDAWIATIDLTPETAVVP